MGSLAGLLAALGWLAWFLGEGSESTVVHSPNSGALMTSSSPGAEVSRLSKPVLPTHGLAQEVELTSDGSALGLHPTAAVTQTALSAGAAPGTPSAIAGVVVGAEDGLPLSRFVLRLHRGVDPSSTDWAQAEIQRVRSISGAFDLGQRPPGLYSLRVTAPGHLPLDTLGLLVPSSEKLTLAVSVGAVISGHLIDVYGRDVADILVELRAAQGSAPPSDGFVRRAQTDDTGDFIFTNVKPGDWQAFLPDPHGGPTPLGVSPIWSVSANGRSVWDATLAGEVTLEVEVFSGGEAAVRGTKARLTSEGGLALLRKVRGGKARFERLRPGSYTLVIQQRSGAVAWEESIVVSTSAEVDARRYHIPVAAELMVDDG
ncbi:MAG: hypothetical protein ACI9EF_001058 [Pseudohongiellaceae bacterium]|jgi:hypothetical protein